MFLTIDVNYDVTAEQHIFELQFASCGEPDILWERLQAEFSREKDFARARNVTAAERRKLGGVTWTGSSLGTAVDFPTESSTLHSAIYHGLVRPFLCKEILLLYNSKSFIAWRCCQH